MTIAYSKIKDIIAEQKLFMVKLLRAQGGCLGARRRGKTWLAAISFGEPLSRLRSGDF